MKRLALVVMLLCAVFLVACERATGDPVGEPPPLATLDPNMPVPTPTFGGDLPGGPNSGEDPGFEIPTIASPNPFPTATIDGEQPPVGVQRFTNLRFAISENGQGQATFPSGTQEVYAIWDYTGMTANDKMERLWFHNNAEYVAREQQWAFEKYGFTGTVRDIYLYDYIDGIDDGQWRVELYLNGELQIIGNFTVGSP
jgi:hypothetical protein